MVRFNFNLNAKAEACFSNRLKTVAMSVCIAVAAAAQGSLGTQPYAP